MYRIVSFVFLYLLFVASACAPKVVLPSEQNSSQKDAGHHLEHNQTDGESDTTEPNPQDKQAESSTPEESTQPEPTKEPTPEPKAETPPQDASTPEPMIEQEPTPEAQPEKQVEPTPEKPNPLKGVGKPCKTDSDCGGKPLYCVKETAKPSFPFPSNTGKGPPGGYCTTRCMIGGSKCPTGSACFVPGAASGACLRSCKTNQDCRWKEGYTCGRLDQSHFGCFPPACKLTKPGGNYDMLIIVASQAGQCPTKPLPKGSKHYIGVKLQGSDIQFTLGSKPGSPLPVTWMLSGPYKNLQTKITATNPKGCSQSCDGRLIGRFSTACVFYGSLEINYSSGCTHNYEVSLTHR